MAKYSLYRLTYAQKPTITLSPDAVVRINRKLEIDICTEGCHKTLNINDFITNMTSSLGIGGAVGSASLSLAIPRHGVSGKYISRGGRIFGINLMDEVEFFIKGRFQSEDTQDFKYYRVFWGVVTAISESYTEGLQTISVSCDSQLKWLALMKTNEHPALINFSNNREIFNLNAAIMTGKTYGNMNVYQIIYSLFTITYLNIVTPTSLVPEVIEQSNKSFSIGVYSREDTSIMSQWKEKFKKLRSGLKMFGVTDKVTAEKSTKVIASQSETNAQMGVGSDSAVALKVRINSSLALGFKPFSKLDDAKKLDLIQNSYKSNLEIINEIKTYTGFEFFLDTTGDFIFKPPFWNIDVKQNPIHVIQDTEILSWDFSESDSEIVTRVEVVGSQALVINVAGNIAPRGIFTDYNLVRTFGMRTLEIPGRLFTTPDVCYYHAISELERINANRFKGTLSIIGRPELRLGFPIYIQSRDCYVYIENITHNFSFGGSFTTQIDFSSMRRKYVSMPEGTSEKAQGSNPDKNKRNLIGAKNRVLIFDMNATQQEQINLYANKDISNKLIPANTEQVKLVEDIRKQSNRFLKSNRGGVYVEYDLKSQSDTIKKKLTTLKQNKNQEGDAEIDQYLSSLEELIPVSDENGYELIGIYENGRNFYFDKDFVIRKKKNNLSNLINSVIGVSTNENIEDIIATVMPISDDPDNESSPPEHTVLSDNKKPDGGQPTKSRSSTTDGAQFKVVTQDLQNFYEDTSLQLSKLVAKDSTDSCSSCEAPEIAGRTIAGQVSKIISEKST